MLTLETERLILSPWRRKDAADLYDYAKNPNVGPPAGWKPHESVKESRKIIRTIFQPNHVWAIRDKQTGKPIGTIGFEEDRYRPNIRSLYLVYSMSDEFCGRVHMTYAAREVIRYGFDHLKLEVICVCTGLENKRSQSVIRKCGFTYEGTLRQAFKVFDGTKRDVMCHSLTREEFYGD